MCDAVDLGCGCDQPGPGDCGCDYSIEDLGCGCGEPGPSGCDEACGSTLEFDECGECGGDNSSVLDVIDSAASNYDDDATIDDGSCEYAENYPDWDVNLGDYTYDASVTSAVYFEGNNFGDEGDLLAAFSGDDVRGVADAVELVNGPPGTDIGSYIFFLTVVSDNNGETLTFKFYDSSEDSILDISDTFEFDADASVGNVIDPFVLNISDGSDPSYYSVDLEDTGESQLTIFSDSITNLSPGDEIGVFDLEAITNYNDCSNQIGELLVGAGVWDGNQLNIVSTGSVDLCAFGGPQLAGFVEGNDVVVKVYKADEGVEYDTELTWSAGTGTFGDVIQQVSEIVLVDPNACVDNDDALAAFGGCAGAVAALGWGFCIWRCANF